jgi:hypothetical protein
MKHKWLLPVLVFFLVLLAIFMLVPRSAKSSLAIRIGGPTTNFTANGREWSVAITNIGRSTLRCSMFSVETTNMDGGIDSIVSYPSPTNISNILKPGEGFCSPMFIPAEAGKVCCVLAPHQRLPGTVELKLRSWAWRVPPLRRWVPLSTVSLAISEWFDASTGMERKLTNTPAIATPVPK